MICIIALIVFAILALFSARFRPLAAEAFDCVFRRVTFRKCRSGLDKRLKADISGKLLKKNKSLGRFVYKYFEVISWIFLILLLLSLVQVGISTYNYAVYGNCNGPDEDGFCIFDPMNNGHSEMSQTGMCAAPGTGPIGNLSVPPLEDLPGIAQTGSANAPITVIEFGCFACPNTAKQAPEIKKLIEHYGTDIHFVYVDFPLPHHEFSEESAMAARCVQEQDPIKYWHYHFTIFDRQEEISETKLHMWAEELGMDMDLYELCMIHHETDWFVQNSIDVAVKSGVYGTPTFFINDEALVGVKKFKLLKAKIDAI